MANKSDNPKPIVVHTRVEQELYVRLAAKAKKKGINLSTLIRNALCNVVNPGEVEI